MKRNLTKKRNAVAMSRLAAASRSVVETMESRLLLSGSIAYSYVADASSHNVAPGQSTTVKIYLQEALNGNPSLLDAGPAYVYNGGEDGLSAAGYKVAVAAGSGSGAAAITASSPNYTDFTGPTSGQTKSSSSQATVEEASGFSSATGVETTGVNNSDAAPVNAVAGDDYVYLGSVTIAAGAVAGTTTTFNLGELDASGGNTITFPDAVNLDGDGNSAVWGVTIPNVSWTGAGDVSNSFKVTTTADVNAPAITSLTPSSGPNNGGQIVTINGSGFASATAVDFGANAATNLTIISDNQVTCTLPASTGGAAGAVNVTVTNNIGTSSPATYTYNESIAYAEANVTNGTSTTLNNNPVITDILSQPGTVNAPVGTATKTFSTSSGYTFLVNDGTGSVEVYGDKVAGYTPAVGDAISVTGTWSPYQGYAELATVTAISKVSSGNAVPAPIVEPSIGPAGSNVDLTASSENSNGILPSSIATQMVTVDNVTITGSYATITDSTGSIAAYYSSSLSSAYADLQGTTVPTGKVNVTGFLAEYNSLPEFYLVTVGAPVVTSVSPAGGLPNTSGTTATINGYGFTTATAVSFGGVAATSITVVSDNQLLVGVPSEAAGTVDVKVSNANGTSTASAADHYTYTTGPLVSGVSPVAGAAGAGTSVTIYGANFTGATGVMFGSVAATSFSVTNSGVITATAPAEAAGTVDVTIVSSAGTSPVNAADHFTYAAVPTVTGINYASDVAVGGLSITITGTGFVPGAVTTVKFGTVTATASVTSTTTITATVPAGTAGNSVDVTVTTPGGTSATSSADKFAYITNTPSINGVETGLNSSATTPGVTLSGTISAILSQPGTTNGKAYTSWAFLINDGTGSAEIYGALPTGSTYVPTVGDNITASGSWSPYNQIPELVSLTAITKVSSGNTVPAPSVDTISQVNLATLPLNVAGYLVTLKGVEISGISGSWGITSLTGTITDTSGSAMELYYWPTSYSGSNFTGAIPTTNLVDITGLVDSYSNTTPEFIPMSITNPTTIAPIVTGVAPASGLTTGGNTVTITGVGFTGATAVDFGATPCTNWTFVSDTQISVTAPADSAGGVVDVTVVNPNGTSATSSADQYLYSSAPAISSVSPTAGSLAGGQSIVITGTGFTGATAVTFGGVAATSFVVNSATQITAVDPAGSAGTVDVAVTTSLGTSIVGAGDRFSYVAAPSVTSLNYSSDVAAGGLKITITGTGFVTGSTSVAFGGVAGTSVTVTSSTSLTVVAPANSVGVVDVVVTTPGGASATSAADKFTYIGSTPTIGAAETGLNESFGTASSATTPSVTFNNVEVTAIVSQPGTVNGKAYTSWAFLVSDGTGSAEIYGLPTGSTYVPTVGDVVSVSGSWNPYHQIPELTSLTALSKVSSGNVVPSPVVETIPAANVDILPNSIAGYYVTIKGVSISGISGNWGITTQTGTITDSAGKSMTLYYWPTSYSASNFSGAIPTGLVDVTGFVSVYGGTSPEFTPMSITNPSSVIPTVTAAPTSGAYTGSAYVASVSVTGAAGADAGAASATTFDYYDVTTSTDLGATAPTSAGSYTVKATFAGDSTYVAGVSSAVAFTISPKAISSTIGNDSQTYGAAAGLASDLPSTFSTGVNGETLAITYASTGDTNGTSVGTYAITAVAGDGTGLASNYTVTFTSGTLTVNPAALTITAANKSMTYGGTLPSLSASYSGFVNGDTSASLTTAPTLSTAAATSNAGTYAITATGAADSNYTITYAPGTLTIGKADLTITAVATPSSVSYGSALPTFSASYSGFVNGDTSASLTTAPTFHTTATTASPAGTYTVTATGAADANYTITYDPGMFTIANAPKAPVFGAGSYSETVAENPKTAGVIATIVATTGAAGQVITYTLTGTDASKFAISSKGVITAVGILDAVAQSSFSFNVVATGTTPSATKGGAPTVVTAAVPVTVTVTDSLAITGAGAVTTTDNNTKGVAALPKVVISDPIATHNETVTITLSHPSYGTLSGTGITAAGAGVYTVTGSAATVTSDIDKALFTPTAHLVAPGDTATEGFTIVATDSKTAVTNSAATVVSTSVDVLPSITGTLAAASKAPFNANNINTTSTATPFAGVSITDPDVSVATPVTSGTAAPETIAVTVTYTAANGTLAESAAYAATTGALTLGGAAGSYTLSGTPAQVTAALKALVFTPATSEKAVTTAFTISAIESNVTGSKATVNKLTTVTAAPTISGTSATAGKVNDNATVSPFSKVIISNPSPTAGNETITVSLSNAAMGKLADSTADAGPVFTLTSPGVYSVTGTAAQVTTALDDLVFTPTAHAVAVKGTFSTAFTITASTAGGSTTTDTLTNVTVTAVDTNPVLSGVVATATVKDNATVTPFATAVVTDPDSGAATFTANSTGTQGETITITEKTATLGSLSTTYTGSDLTSATFAKGVLTIVAKSAAAATSALQDVVFTPTAHAVALGATGSEVLTVAVVDAAGGKSGTTGNTSTITISPNDDGPTSIKAVLTAATLKAVAPKGSTTPVIAAATSVVTLSNVDPDLGATFTYTLVSGTGSANNSDFTVGTGKLSNQLVAANSLAVGTYNVLVQVADQGGKSVQQALTITIGTSSCSVALA